MAEFITNVLFFGAVFALCVWCFRTASQQPKD